MLQYGITNHGGAVLRADDHATHCGHLAADVAMASGTHHAIINSYFQIVFAKDDSSALKLQVHKQQCQWMDLLAAALGFQEAQVPRVGLCRPLLK